MFPRKHIEWITLTFDNSHSRSSHRLTMNTGGPHGKDFRINTWLWQCHIPSIRIVALFRYFYPYNGSIGVPYNFSKALGYLDRV